VIRASQLSRLSHMFNIEETNPGYTRKVVIDTYVLDNHCSCVETQGNEES